MASRKMSKSKATGGEKRLNEIFEDAIRSQEEAHDSGQELKKDYIENVDKVKFEASGRPSKAMLALIDRYKCTSQKDLVYNTIDQVIQENIYKIQQAVSNMIKYGDTKVFKVLPKELDAEMRDYGMAAQEYFGKKVAELNTSANSINLKMITIAHKVMYLMVSSLYAKTVLKFYLKNI